jgi:hypothetical protein
MIALIESFSAILFPTYDSAARLLDVLARRMLHFRNEAIYGTDIEPISQKLIADVDEYEQKLGWGAFHQITLEVEKWNKVAQQNDRKVTVDALDALFPLFTSDFEPLAVLMIKTRQRCSQRALIYFMLTAAFVVPPLCVVAYKASQQFFGG